MQKLNNDTYESTLSNIFKDGGKAVVFYGQPNCKACHKTFDNYNKVKDELTTNTHFYYVDFTECWKPEEYTELYNLNTYPKIIIFNGSFSNVDFSQGEYKIDDFKRI